jgi:hypothetical protein
LGEPTLKCNGAHDVKTSALKSRRQADAFKHPLRILECFERLTNAFSNLSSKYRQLWIEISRRQVTQSTFDVSKATPIDQSDEFKVHIANRREQKLPHAISVQVRFKTVA